MEREPEEGPGDRKPKGKAVFRKDKNIVEQISEKIRKALSEEVKLSEIEEEPPSNIDLTKILTVDDCVNAAMDNYMPIKVAKEQIKLAKFKVNEAFRELFPVVSLLWTETSGKISQELYRGRKYGFEFKQPIFHGGELYFTWEQSKTNLKIAKENYNKVKEDLTHEVAKTYYELAKALNKLDIQKELFEKIKDDIERAKKEYELGLSTQLESLNAQSSYDQVFYSIAAAENDVSLKQLALAKSMHINVGTKINIDYKLKLKEFDINIDECLGLAMQNRSELKTKRLIVESTRIGERIAQSQLWPQLDLVGKYLKAAEQLEPRGLGMNLKNERFIGITAKAPLGSHTFEYQKKKGKLAPTVTTFASDTRYDTDVYKLTPFDDLGRYTSMKNAYVMRQQALSELKDVKQDLHSDVREAFYSFKEAQIKLNGSRNNLQLYEKEFLTMDLRKKLNEATTSEVMNAKIKFYTEKSVYTSAIGDIYLAIAGLNKAIGIGGYFK